MPRFFAAFSLLLLTAQAHATLAVLIPTRDGFVVATDSRTTYMGAHCDGTPKIYIPALPSRTVAVVTGDSIFVQPPNNSKALNPCQWLASAPRLLDMGAVVAGYLKQSSGQSTGDLTQISIADLAAACVHATEQFQQSWPAALRPYAGKEIFSVVVASYDPGTVVTTLRSFVVRMAARTGSGGVAAGPIESARVTETKVDHSSSRGVWIYGEADWVDRVVYKGPGRRFLDAATLDFLNLHSGGETQVSEVPLEQAKAVATNVIQAAVRTALINPPPSGIGGEIRFMAVGSNPLPQDLLSLPQH